MGEINLGPAVFAASRDVGRGHIWATPTESAEGRWMSVMVGGVGYVSAAGADTGVRRVRAVSEQVVVMVKT